MTADSQNPAGATIPANGDKASVTVPANATESPVGDFGTISFTAAGTYTFTFAEDSYTYPGITPVAGQTPTLTIEVEDDKQGGLRIKTVTKNGDVLTTDDEAVFTALFTNKYVAEPTYYQPHVKKLMTNISRPLPVKV